jgi:hypothetical protein
MRGDKCKEWEMSNPPNFRYAESCLTCEHYNSDGTTGKCSLHRVKRFHGDFSKCTCDNYSKIDFNDYFLVALPND